MAKGLHSKFKKSKRNLAFTSIEHLLSLMAITILGGIGMGAYVFIGEDAKAIQTLSKMKQIQKIIRGSSELDSAGKLTQPGYRSDMGRYPASLSDLVDKGTQRNFSPYTKMGWRGPYIQNSAADWNKDAWGTQFEFDATELILKSCGADGICAGAFADDDLVLNVNR